jgi:hypothetical protein
VTLVSVRTTLLYRSFVRDLISDSINFNNSAHRVVFQCLADLVELDERISSTNFFFRKSLVLRKESLDLVLALCDEANQVDSL